MINKRHIEDLKNVLETMIDEIVAMQTAVHEDQVSPEQVRDFFGALGYSQHVVSGIMYSAGVDVDGAYNEDE